LRQLTRGRVTRTANSQDSQKKQKYRTMNAISPAYGVWKRSTMRPMPTAPACAATSVTKNVMSRVTLRSYVRFDQQRASNVDEGASRARRSVAPAAMA
jgi:hypothetical protein